MAITQVVQEFSRKGGIECVAFELQAAWQRAGVLSRVIAGIAPGSETRPDVTLLSSPFRNVATRGRFGRYLGRLFVIPAFTLSATSHLRRRGDDDLVLSHGDTLSGDVLVIHALNKASLKQKRKEGEHRWMLNPMNWWAGARDRLMIGGLRYSTYVALSSRVKHELMDLYGVPEQRIAVIPNGVDTDRYTPEGPGRAEIRCELGIPANAKVLLFVGHEFGRKGLGPIVEAMKLLPPDTFLIVVGDDDKSSYQKTAVLNDYDSRVIFTGPRYDLPEIYRASDAFVFPTSYEAFGLVTMEALASGVPIFATRVGGIEDYLEDGQNGYFITRDAADIACKVSSVLSDPARLEAMKLAARATALSYTWDMVAALYCVLFERVRQAKAANGSGHRRRRHHALVVGQHGLYRALPLPGPALQHDLALGDGRDQACLHQNVAVDQQLDPLPDVFPGPGGEQRAAAVVQHQ